MSPQDRQGCKAGSGKLRQTLARLFAALTLVVVVFAVWVVIAPQIGKRNDLAVVPPPPVGPALPPEIAKAPLGPDSVGRIVIEKAARRLTAYRDGQPVRIYRIDLGFAPVGDKARQGDGRTPEGLYRVDRRNTQSAYHLSLGIDYPTAAQKAKARTDGVDPGGDIFIHGAPNDLPAGTRLAADWTAGCIAITNPQIKELFDATPIGATVEILP